jgi:hypothetical protein
MSLDKNDWREIMSFVEKRMASLGESFIQGKVVKNDTINKLVWLKELGDQPIPLVGFDYQVKYNYVNSSGQTVIKKTTAHSGDVEMLTPRVGDIVLVALHLGSRRLPKCLGVIKSTNYVRAGGSD